jgi:hypothetical protein
MIRSSLTTKRVAGAALAVALGTGLGLGAISMWSADGATTPQAYRVDSTGFPSTSSGGPESPAGSSSAPAPADTPAPAPADAPAPAPVDTSDGMTIEEASAIALAFTPGRVVEVDQDQDFLTGLRYDVTVLHDNGSSTDVEIDAESGRIVSTDFDNDWD